jgi:hypothetical protein
MPNYVAARTARALIFAFGNLRSQPHAPWFSFGTHGHGIPMNEVMTALKLAQYGDIGLHRDRGFFTNLTIPGAMKHAWIHTHDTDCADGRDGGLITEATSDGVLSKHAIIPYLSDYAILLRPRGLTEAQRRGACLRAKTIQGADYDVNFNFDLEEQAQFYENPENLKAAEDEGRTQESMLRRWDRSFSCSEAVAYCYWHVRETLRIYRRPVLGKQAILPQDFIGFDFDIVWASSSLTVEVARKMNFNEEALTKLDAYHKGYYR